MSQIFATSLELIKFVVFYSSLIITDVEMPPNTTPDHPKTMIDTLYGNSPLGEGSICYD